MFAILAGVAFLLALVFHVAGGTVLKYYIDAELLGLIFLAVHLVWPYRPWGSRRQQAAVPPPVA